MQFLLFWHHREQRNVSDSLSVFSVELFALLLALLLNGKIPAGALQSSLLPVSHPAMEGFLLLSLEIYLCNAWLTHNQCTSFAVIVSVNCPE